MLIGDAIADVVYTDEEGNRYVQNYRYGKILSTTPISSKVQQDHRHPPSVKEFRQFMDKASDWCRTFGSSPAQKHVQQPTWRLTLWQR